MDQQQPDSTKANEEKPSESSNTQALPASSETPASLILTNQAGSNEPTAAEAPCQFCGHVPAAEAHRCLLPALKPVADKYGRDKLDFALNVAGANAAFESLRKSLQMLPKTWHVLGIVEETVAQLAHDYTMSKQWQFPEILAIMTAVGEVKRNMGPRLVDRQGRVLKPAVMTKAEADAAEAGKGLSPANDAPNKE